MFNILLMSFITTYQLSLLLVLSPFTRHAPLPPSALQTINVWMGRLSPECHYVEAGNL